MPAARPDRAPAARVGGLPRRARASRSGPARRLEGELANVRKPASPDAGGRPTPALSWADRVIPALTGVRPLVCQSDLDAITQSWEAAHRNDPTRLVAPLFGTVLPDPGPDGTLQDRLTRALEQVAPLSEVNVHVQNREGYLIVQASAHQDGVVSLARLHAALSQQDARLLPGILAVLENASSVVMPVLGPRAAANIAEHWYNTDHLLEFSLPEHLGREEPLDLSERQAIQLARRWGLPHARVVQDATPWPYFRQLLTGPEVLARLEALPAAWQGVRDLGPLLAQLVEHSEALPELTLAEASEVQGLLIPHTFLTVDPTPYGIAEETVDEFVRNHWEAGEEEPQYVLYVDLTPESQARLGAYLRLAPLIEQACVALVDRLRQLNLTCPPVREPRPGGQQ